MENEKIQPEAAASEACEAQPAAASESPAGKDDKKKSVKSEIMDWVKTIVPAVILAFIILQIIQPTMVRSTSMLDTLVENDYLIVYKLAYKFGGEPKLGDIVVFESDLTTDSGAEKLLIKRVIGTPGDTIAIKEGLVYINGEAIEEPYLKDGYTNGDIDETVIPEGMYFMMGDNRLGSMDSRDSRVGMVSGDALIGKAVFRLFPFSKFGGLY